MPTKNRKTLLRSLILLATIVVGMITYIAITNGNNDDSSNDISNQDALLAQEEANKQQIDTTLTLHDLSMQLAESKDDKDAALLAKASFLTVAGRYSESLDVIKPLEEGYTDLSVDNQARLLVLRARNFAKTGKFSEAALDAEKYIALDIFGDETKVAEFWQQAYDSLTNNTDPFIIAKEDSE